MPTLVQCYCNWSVHGTFDISKKVCLVLKAQCLCVYLLGTTDNLYIACCLLTPVYNLFRVPVVKNGTVLRCAPSSSGAAPLC